MSSNCFKDNHVRWIFILFLTISVEFSRGVAKDMMQETIGERGLGDKRRKRRSGWLCSPVWPIFQTARHSERIDKVRARSLLSQNNPFVRGPGWRRGALSPLAERGASEEPPPAAILLFVQPSAVTLASLAWRHPPSRPIGAFNRQQPANVEKRINP